MQRCSVMSSKPVLRSEFWHHMLSKFVKLFFVFLFDMCAYTMCRV